MTVDQFKEDILVTYKDNILDVVRKNLINGGSYFFEHSKIDDDEYLIKKDLSTALKIHPNNILIVGSAKLGFSIKPEKSESLQYKFKEFRFDYDNDSNIEESDIDIAVIDSTLFDQELEKLYLYMINYDDIKITELFDDCLKVRFQKKCFYSYSKYILMGWLRPDKMPKGFKLFKSIEDIQDKYRKRYNRKINIGIYKSWFYFENYNLTNLTNMKNVLDLEELNKDE